VRSAAPRHRSTRGTADEPPPVEPYPGPAVLPTFTPSVPPLPAHRRWGRRLARGPAARLAALPVRIGAVARYDTAVLVASARWLVRSREHTNFTYQLTERNTEHLAWYVAAVAGIPVADARGYLAEVTGDWTLHEHLRRSTAASARRRLADPEPRLGRRAGWYALVRALKPGRVVETGTDKGLGSCVLAAALLRNGRGRLTTVDVNPEAGYLIGGPYRAVVDLEIGDSVPAIGRCPEPIDLFLHDSDHSPGHEARELAAAGPLLSDRALVLTDNAEATDELARWADRTGRRFLYFAERPADHWYPGGGIGAAFR
jgi:predicted O-methyltransferase YrrM